MKTRHCDECAHFTNHINTGFAYHININVSPCDKGHKPRFHVPSLDPRDTDWGYKRKCADFAPKETK